MSTSQQNTAGPTGARDSGTPAGAPQTGTPTGAASGQSRGNTEAPQAPQGPQGQQNTQGNHHPHYRKDHRAPTQPGGGRSRAHNTHHNGHNNAQNNSHTNHGHHRSSASESRGNFSSQNPGVHHRGHRNSRGGIYDQANAGMPAFPAAYMGQYVPIRPNLMSYQMMPFGPGGVAGPPTGPPGAVLSPPPVQVSPYVPIQGAPGMQAHPAARVPIRLTNSQGEIISLETIAHSSPRAAPAALHHSPVPPAAAKLVPDQPPKPVVEIPKKAAGGNNAATALKDLIAQRLKAEQEASKAKKTEPTPEPKKEARSKPETAEVAKKPAVPAASAAAAAATSPPTASPAASPAVAVAAAGAGAGAGITPATAAVPAPEKPSEKAPEKIPAKPSEKTPETVSEKVSEKAAEKPAAKTVPKVEKEPTKTPEPASASVDEPPPESEFTEPKSAVPAAAVLAVSAGSRKSASEQSPAATQTESDQGKPKSETPAAKDLDRETTRKESDDKTGGATSVDESSEFSDASPSAESKLQSSKDSEISPSSSPKLEPTDKEEVNDEAFLEHLAQASRPSPEEVSKLTYPNDVTNSAKSDQKYLYDIQFLRAFAPAVPGVEKDRLSKIMCLNSARSFSMSRGMSQRTNRQGSHVGFGQMRDGRMSRNASITNMGSRSGRQGSRRKGDRQGSSRHDKDDKPPMVVEPLKRSENAWVPRFQQKKAAAEAAASESELIPPDEVERRVKSLLNKMTLENFERIYKQIFEIMEQSRKEKDAATVHQVIELTLAKAVDEPHWSAMYAAFCLQASNLPDDIVDETSTLVDENGNTVTYSGRRLFRRYLLSRCQTEFEKGWSSQISGEDGQQANVMSDEYYAAVKAKRHGLGLIRLLGELFKVGFLSPKIITGCFYKLVHEEPNEDIVESMCKLVVTVAQRMVKDEAGNAIEFAMQKLTEWRETPGFPSRLRFMIMDVEDTRKNGWKNKDLEKGPKTITQIHTEIAKEQRAAEEEKVRSQRSAFRQNAFGRDRDRDRDRDRERGDRRERDRQARMAQQAKMTIDREQSMSGRRQPSHSEPTPKQEQKLNRYHMLETE